jgi:hypothetical protein
MKSSADPSERGADEALAVREGSRAPLRDVYQPANAMTFAASRLGSGLGIWHAGDLAARRSGNQARMKLRCEECGCATELARGWRAMIVEDEDDPEMDAYVVC